MAQWVKHLPAVQETQEMQVRFLSREDPLEEEMATHSSTLAWRTPWTGSLAGSSSKGGQELAMTVTSAEGCFAELCPFLLPRRVNQLCLHHTHSLLDSPGAGRCRASSRFLVLCGLFPSTVYFIHSINSLCVHHSLPILFLLISPFGLCLFLSSRVLIEWWYWDYC